MSSLNSARSLDITGALKPSGSARHKTDIGGTLIMRLTELLGRTLYKNETADKTLLLRAKSGWVLGHMNTEIINNEKEREGKQTENREQTERSDRRTGARCHIEPV